MQIKIYTKEYTPLTTLIQSAEESDYNQLVYSDGLMQVGEASFLLRLDNPKTTLANLQHYNIVEIAENDDTVRWVGVIVYRRVLFNTVEVNCLSLAHLLARRITPSEIFYNSTTGAIAAALLDDTNYIEDTMISQGTTDESTAVEVTFNYATIFDALKRLAEISGGQFKINNDRTLDFKTFVGQDLSESVIFQYRLSLIAAANILNFQVDDDGRKITTQTFGESEALTSDQEDTALSDQFGLLQDFENFREISDQTSLDSATAENNTGSALSPRLQLAPDVPDNFEVGDWVRVILSNRIIDIDDTYQITEKRVVAKGGGERSIEVRVISNTSDFFRDIRDLKRSVDLLSRSL